MPALVKGKPIAVSAGFQYKEPTVKIRRLQYDRENLKRAYEETQKGVSVYKAARMFSVPEQTLRDRTKGFINFDCTRLGPDTLFTNHEDNQLVHHLLYMANIGYGYNKTEIQFMARDFAVSIGKNVKSSHSLSNSWFYGFHSRHPELKRVMPQKLSIHRAKAASREQIDSYFKELGNIITSNNLSTHPECIYNIDETGVSTEHTPSKIICGKNTVAQSITSSRSSNVTIIAGGNALGNDIPPYYIFPGKRWNGDFLQGAPAGSSGETTDSGWSTSSVFYNYLTKHFKKYVNLSSAKDGQKILILYDGHKSHIQLTLTHWAQKNNVTLYVLPPHTSHITQPLDIGIFGSFKSMYNNECHAYMRKNPGLHISKYNIAELTATPYIKALRPQNLLSAFQKAGIYPFNSKLISSDQVAPAIIYEDNTHENLVPPDSTQATVVSKSQNVQPLPNEENNTNNFFKQRTITNVKLKPKRRFVPPFIVGNLSKKSNVAVLTDIANKKTKTEGKKLPKQVQTATDCKNLSNVNRESIERKIAKVPKAGTSGLSKGGGLINLSPSDTESDSDMSVAENDLCCVCKGWQPEELRACETICFVTWGKCDFCCHWTHLKFCSDIRVLRRNSIFCCPHCTEE